MKAATISAAIFVYSLIYSGWVEAYPLKSKATEGIWERMANDYVPHHCALWILISDQSSEFRGAAWEQWLEKNGIEHGQTMAITHNRIAGLNKPTIRYRGYSNNWLMVREQPGTTDLDPPSQPFRTMCQLSRRSCFTMLDLCDT